MSITLREPDEPLMLTQTPGGHDLASVEGTPLLAQRVLRFLFTTPGEILHRPGWGAGLQKYANKPPLPSVMARMRNDFRTALGQLPYVEGYAFDIAHTGALYVINIRVRINGEIYKLPEVNL